MLKENWTPVFDNENYEVSMLGEVRRSDTHKVLKQKMTKDGYMRINLSDNGIRKTRQVHRLVLQTFVECHDPNNMQVNHIDGNKTNNEITNLEWVTGKENTRHAYASGLAKPNMNNLKRREKGYKSTLKGRKIPHPNAHNKKPIMINETKDKYESIKECSDKTGLSSKKIQDVLAGRRKSHHGYHFTYLEKCDNNDEIFDEVEYGEINPLYVK